MRMLFLLLLAGITHQAAHAQTPTVKWYLDLGDAAFGQTFAKDVNGDGKLELFFSTYRNDGYIYCVNAPDGVVRWKKRFPGEVGSCMDAGPLVFDSAHNGKYRIIVPGSCNYSTKCLDAVTGATLWSTNIGGSDSPPSMGDIDNDGIPDLLMGNFLGYEYCLNPFTGSEKWRIQVDATVNYACINTEPVIVENSGGLDFVVGTAWVTSLGGQDKVACYKGSDHTLKWEHFVHNTVYEGAATGDLYRDGHKEIVVGDWDGYLYNFNAENGTLNWSVRYGTNYMSAVTLADVDKDGYLNIIYSDNGHIYALKPDGSILWSYATNTTTLRGAVAVDVNNDHYPDVTISTYNGMVTSLSGLDGSVIKSVDMNALYGRPYEIDHAPVIADFDNDGVLDLFVVGGHGNYPDTAADYGRAYCMSWGVGHTPAWTIFRHDERRTGCLCDNKGLPLGNTVLPAGSTSASISLFPNPAQDELTIDLSGLSSSWQEFTITVNDITGKTLIREETKNNINAPITMNVKKLPPGVYLATIATDGAKYIKQFVKQ